MKKRFIALIDFSDHSERLLQLSYNWATQTGAQLLLIHHSVEPIPGLGEAEVLSKMKRESGDRILERLKSFAEGVIGIDERVGYHTDFYNIPSAVVKLREQGTVDYLFVGMNDKTELEKLVNASTALQLRDHTDSIIIALPTATSEFRFDHFHVGIKASYPLDEKRFDELLAIAPDMARHINFFSVLKKGSDRNKASIYLQNIAVKYTRQIPASYNIIEADHTTAAIKEYMRANRGVLVVQKGPRNFIDIFRKFFTTDIVHHAQIPVIILP